MTTGKRIIVSELLAAIKDAAKVGVLIEYDQNLGQIHLVDAISASPSEYIIANLSPIMERKPIDPYLGIGGNKNSKPREPGFQGNFRDGF